MLSGLLNVHGLEHMSHLKCLISRRRAMVECSRMNWSTVEKSQDVKRNLISFI